MCEHVVHHEYRIQMLYNNYNYDSLIRLSISICGHMATYIACGSLISYDVPVLGGIPIVPLY